MARGRGKRDTPEDEVDLIIAEWRDERPDVDAASIGVFGRVSRLLPLQRAAAAHLHREHGLSVAAFDVLASLRRSGSPFRKTVGELAASSLLTSSAVTLRLDNLERDGLVRRVRTGGDRRQVFAELTEDGLRRIDAIFDEHIALERRLLRQLDPTEQAELSRLLRKLSFSVRDEAPDDDLEREDDRRIR
ncbi:MULTISPECIES: MarR family winged helix-turn-helix transcriptional regulator [unclassified Nocardioides]|uniref:MarR family winged helix-turn-helix transcriptional regulator n=1 Tax=unclassified Nocardioides TaxID=2615069 RepID=UPI0006F53053|nr:MULTISPECIES: MarR family transcriptional regulator [unclassified Nocardioides]KQY64625.1 MarR family transcriptional regulator [Nocardioides sp. Root140]KRF12529.1 MarR family transcriptional regulator [Nocardioides sp. Soil796]